MKSQILQSPCQYLAILAQAGSAAAFLWVFFAILGGYFAFRYFALKRALREITRDLLEIQQDIARNQILHLPLPDRTLEQAITSVNGTLEEIRSQRLAYEQREKEFQKQIENISHDLRTPLTVILGYLKWMKRDAEQAASSISVESPGFPQGTAQAALSHQEKPLNLPDQGMVREALSHQEKPLNLPNQGMVRETLSHQEKPLNLPDQGMVREALSRQEKPLNLPDQDMVREALSRQAESLEILERNARTMERLVSQFYTFSQLHAHDYSLVVQDVDVCRILRESLAEHWKTLQKAHLRLNSILPEHPVVVRGNKEGLERIFSNMFQNAGRYARSYLNIRMEEGDKRQVHILFQNDSEKIEEDAIPRLFERFYQNSNARNRGGSGLGLTISKTLAEAMGGSLQASIVPEELLSASGIVSVPVVSGTEDSSIPASGTAASAPAGSDTADSAPANSDTADSTPAGSDTGDSAPAGSGTAASAPAGSDTADSAPTGSDTAGSNPANSASDSNPVNSATSAADSGISASDGGRQRDTDTTHLLFTLTLVSASGSQGTIPQTSQTETEP